MQKVCAEYVWVDSDGNLRSKTKVLTYQPTTITGNGNGNDGNDGNDGDDGDDPLPDVVDHLPLLLSDLPKWNFDGSSTGQAEGHYSEIDLKPVKLIPCPFKKGDNILVLCECYNPNGTPAVGNNRFTYVATFASENVSNEKPWFGIEQEYTLMGNDRLGQTHHNRPFAWTLHKKIGRQGPYYCSTGSSKAIGREVAEAHLEACLYSGLSISGINAEVMPGQWEYQVGPCEGIDAGDQLLLSRYILHRVAEKYEMNISFHPKPKKGDWNGAGAHVNYSTKSMRHDTKCAVINAVIEKLKEKHLDHIMCYGIDNEMRLTGKHETSSMTDFSSGEGNRGASIRIPTSTAKKGQGYIEDRRPASNMDPYLVTGRIVATTLL